MRRLFFAASLLALLAGLAGSAAVVWQHSVQTFGAVDGLPDPALAARPASLRGVNVALEQYDEAGLAHALDQVRGFAWLRQTFAWNGASPDQADWETWDRLVAAVAGRDQQLIAVLTQPQPSAPPSPEALAAFASAFAERFGDRLAVYQIWDEPNLYSAWGAAPSAAQYTAVLQAAYAAIHAADPTATVLAAALAPTLETGPDNLSDLLYLQALYDVGAAPYFDAAAGKPYGFYTGPEDRAAAPDRLNFSRFTLLRQVMERNGDGHKLLWASAFGWNTRPDSAWGQATVADQSAHTLRAWARAAEEWPWAGPLILEDYQPAAPADDPRWGFAFAGADGQLTPLGQALSAAPAPAAAVPGNYAADHPAAAYVGAWEFSEMGADIPEAYADARLTFQFTGTELALRVRRGDYRAYLYVTVDGQPANRLPHDDRGAYLILTAPDLQPELATLPVAAGLDPEAIHTAVIEPERGWDQWAIAGFAVGRRRPVEAFGLALSAALVLVSLGLVGTLAFGRGLKMDGLAAAWRRLGEAGQLALTAVVGAGLYLSAWLAFESELAGLTRRAGDTVPLLITALTAGLFYFSPSFVVACLALAALFGLFVLRLDLALAFIAAFIPFFLFPRLLWERGASLLEFAVWLAAGAWLVRAFIRWRSSVGSAPQKGPGLAARLRRLSFIDWGVLALLTVAALSTLAAARRDVALYEFRTVLLGATLYYGLLRVTPLDQRTVWRIVDFFVLGATAVAAVGLYQYFFDRSALIMTEEGVARIRSVYGSPNNLGLYLGRALPLALAGLLLTRSSAAGAPWRRALYALSAIVMAAALGLSFSRGALVLGVPAALAVLVIGWQGRRGAWLVGAGLAAALAALPLLAQVPRFAGMFDLQSGTGFFRVNLWQSAWRMFLDHPLLGVGPDNFLYAYRGFYILPQAWQEPNLSHPHNLGLDFLTRLGLFGALTGLALLAGFGRAAGRALRPGASTPDQRVLVLGLLALVADMLAHGLVDHAFFLVDLAYAFYLALALVQNRPREAL